MGAVAGGVSDSTEARGKWFIAFRIAGLGVSKAPSWFLACESRLVALLSNPSVQRSVVSALIIGGNVSGKCNPDRHKDCRMLIKQML